MMADPDRSPARVAFEDFAQQRGNLPFDPLTPEAWATAGLDPHKGIAIFSFVANKKDKNKDKKKKHDHVLVLPVTDRALFRSAFFLSVRIVDGRELDQLDDETLCEPAAGRYLCARSHEVIAAAAAPHASPLASSAAELEEHGEVEIVVTRDASGIARFNHDVESAGWLTGVTGALHLREDGATLHLHGSGSLATPVARGVYAAPPRPDLLALARGAPAVARFHIDPIALSAPPAEVEPDVRAELLEQLTGDIEVLPNGRGFANAAIMMPVADQARVEAFVKKRCAETAAKKEKSLLGGFTVQAHGCAAAFDTAALPIPVVKLPRVPITVTVADKRLVIAVGDPGEGFAHDDRMVENPAAKRALKDPQTVVFYGRNLGVGPEVGAAELFRAAIPLFGGRVAQATNAWSYVTAHIYEAFGTARVTDEGGDLTVDLTSFAADPAPAQAAYGAALTRRFAGDDPGYRAALASIERTFPGTRAARRAAEVRAGAPYFGAGAAVLGTIGLIQEWTGGDEKSKDGDGKSKDGKDGDAEHGKAHGKGESP
jgi:hypothetical protein